MKIPAKSKIQGCQIFGLNAFCSVGLYNCQRESLNNIPLLGKIEIGKKKYFTYTIYIGQNNSKTLKFHNVISVAPLIKIHSQVVGGYNGSFAILQVNVSFFIQ